MIEGSRLRRTPLCGRALPGAIWGVLYGYARARTDSIYPPVALYAAMNLVVALV